MAVAEYVMPDQVQHVLAALTYENALVCRVCLHTGLRVGDVLALRADKLARQFWITERKTGKRRRVNLPQSLVDELRMGCGGGWVFPGRGGRKPRTRQAVWKDLKRAARAFRLPQNLSTHSLRKNYAVDLLRRSGGDVERVRRALNHSSQAVTMIYCMAAQIYEARYGASQHQKCRRTKRGGGARGARSG